ncbi:hypothetical protein [Enterococcus sp. AZ189]|uniref:hypothetical protein n=1 Tax=Enterococcus sp. AZ189 TaxID=2774871 RepID=UPI003F1F6047
MVRRWTEDEDIYLEYFLFSQDSKLEIAAKHLNRSLNATIKHAAVVRAKRKDYYICRKWTEDEDDYIKASYRSLSYENIGLRIGRSRKAVSERVRKLGLRKNNSLISLNDEIRQMAAEGFYPIDIAKSLKLDYETLREYLNKHNIEYRAMPTEESLEKARSKSPWNVYKFII